MKNNNHHISYLAFICLSLAALAASCDRFDGDTMVPSYIKIDAINVVDNPSDSWSQETGFFSSDIDAVNIVIWKKGDTAETTIGTFQLPCKVPVLRSGLIDYVLITPAVKQDGISGKRISYPFYQVIRLDSVTLVADSVIDFGTLQTKYISKTQMKVLWKEMFEPGPGELTLDSTVLRCYSLDTVRASYGDYGCGVVRVPAGTTSVAFATDTTYTINDPQATLYLEMDYWSDFDFSIELKNPSYQQGPVNLVSHMVIFGKPEKGWQKIYINIGSTWSQHFNHYPDIRPHFTILNNEGRPGNLFIDNIKLIVM
ncbi:MAG: hypothetical protein J6031_06860 [Bacteroidales bacterium]|nr:hypothetical protein [Bacteroidales bacterium]